MISRIKYPRTVLPAVKDISNRGLDNCTKSESNNVSYYTFKTVIHLLINYVALCSPSLVNCRVIYSPPG